MQNLRGLQISIDKKKGNNEGATRTISKIAGGMVMNQEEQRLKEARDEKILWKKWGPYLSECQWGTVREDYSEAAK